MVIVISAALFVMMVAADLVTEVMDTGLNGVSRTAMFSLAGVPDTDFSEILKV